MNDATTTGLKIAALVSLAIPMLFLTMLAIGEVAVGMISGLQHVAQLLPLAMLGWLGWRRPLLAGILFVAAARHEHTSLGTDQRGS